MEISDIQLEGKLKRENKQYKYLPNKSFKGMQECFSKIDI